MNETSEANPYAPAIIAGLIGGLISTLTAISYSALVFSGPLSAFAAQGISLGVFSAMVLGLFVALHSSYPGSIAIPQPRIAPLSLLVATAAATAMGAQANPEKLFLTVVASLCVTSVTTGLVLLVLGSFKAGRFVRFVPYPVVGGFLAGAGWLLVAGAYKVMTAKPVGLESTVESGAWGDSMVLVPGLVLAVTLVLILRRGMHYLSTPVTLVGSILLFYLMLYGAGGDTGAAFQQGWLLGPLPDGDGWSFLTVDAMSAVDWRLLVSQTGVFATIALVSTLSLLLHASSIELAAKADIDLNREMQAAGAANLISGAASGIVGFHAVGPSMLVLKLGKPRRLAGITAAAFPAATLLFGLGLLSYLPRFVVGGLLLFLGLSFLVQWLWDGFKRLSRSDYAIVLAILLTVGWAGYLEGIAVGMVLALALFVVNYSRINVVRQAANGAVLQSNVDRPDEVRRLLLREGERTLVFKLQGFIFFGTANGMLEQVRHHLDDKQAVQPRFIILDFRSVTGFDTSASISFVKLSQLAQKHDFKVVLSDVSENALSVLNRGGVGMEGDHCLILPDMDRALERCEELVLLQMTGVNYRASTGLEELVDHAGLTEEQSGTLMGYMERLDLPAGERFIEADTPAEELFFLEAGRVSVSVRLSDGREIRVRTMGEGTIIGELGLYVGQSRTASVVTDLPCVLLRMHRDALERMEKAHPDVAMAFHKHMIRQVGQQLVQTKMALERVS